MVAAAKSQDQLARRLLSLRTRSWPGRRITQSMLGDALAVSTASISSWESAGAVPPIHRLEAYATFFASERSVEHKPYRVLPIAELTEDERARQKELFAELVTLSDFAQGREPPAAGSPLGNSLWSFPVDEDITIVCSELPSKRLERFPYADPDMPDYAKAYKYADLDALLELHGHIRAVNPTSQVRIRIAAEMVPDEYTTHLVLLGGVDWNPVTAELLAENELPVRQVERQDDSTPGGFEVGVGEQSKLIAPVLLKLGMREMLREDVAHFYRSANPLNKARTVTICNGTYQRGTLGAVRALTDEGFRDRNEQYIRTRFGGADTFSLISRVRIVNRAAITPDWTQAENRLHEWPEEPGADD